MKKYGVNDGEVIGTENEPGEIARQAQAEVDRREGVVPVQEILDEGTAGESPCRS